MASGPVVHAGFWKRLAAALIDGVAMGCISCGILLPMSALFGIGTSLTQSLAMGHIGGSLEWDSGGGIVAGLLPACLYHGAMTSSSLQATLGKWAVGIKVVRRDGSRLTFLHAALRQLAAAGIGLATCGVGSLASAAMVGMSVERRAIHDLACDTLVVDRYAFTPEHGRQSTMIGPVALAVLMLTGLAAMAAIAMLGASLASLVGSHR